MRFEYVDDDGGTTVYEPSNGDIKDVAKKMLYRYMTKGKRLDKQAVYATLDFIIDDCGIDMLDLVNEGELADEFHDEALTHYRNGRIQKRDDWSDYESAKGVVYGRI